MHERNLWGLLGEDLDTGTYYNRWSGRTIDDDDAVVLYRLWCDLCEISLSVSAIRSSG